MGDVMILRGRQRLDMDSWSCWDDVLDEPSLLAGDSREGTATRSTCRAGVTSVSSLSRCHSLDAEDALYHGHGHAQLTFLQPAQGSQQQEQAKQEQCSALLQSMSEYLASGRTSEHSPEPVLHSTGHELAMGCSGASSQSDDSLLSLMLDSEAVLRQQSVPANLTTFTGLPDVATPNFPGHGKAACAEQQGRGSEGLRSEASPEPAGLMLDDMFMQAASSDSSAEYFGSVHAQPFGIKPSTLQQPASTLNRRRGRPRRYDTTLPLGAMNGHAAAGATVVNGMQPGVRKRGAKPKYKFMTAEEAVAHRRERNRSTAIATHERKKAREAALKAELSLRQGEHDALQRLLKYVQQPKADKEMIRKLLLGEEGAGASICDAMEFLLTAGE